MFRTSRCLKQLDKELLALGEDAMLLEELDGFIVGLLTCPELIMPRDWLPVVWHEDSMDQQPAFENLEHANRVLGLVMAHYNDVARTLMERPDSYSPLFSIDTRNSDVLWELWIEGFEKAIALRPAAWKTLLDADGDTAAAMSGMLLLIDIAQGEKKMDDQDPIVAAPPDKIAGWVIVLNEWRLANTQAGLEEKKCDGPAAKGRSQRPMPMRLRQKIQEMLRPQLIATAVPARGLRCRRHGAWSSGRLSCAR